MCKVKILHKQCQIYFQERLDLLPIYRMASDNGGAILFNKSTNVILATTDPKLYEYFPTDTSVLAKINIVAAGSIFICNTEVIYRDMLYWWILHALVQIVLLHRVIVSTV